MKMSFRIFLALALLSLIASTSPASAESTNHIVISELQTAMSASASQEFIELYNPTGNDISLSGYVLEYKSATSQDIASSWVVHATLSGLIPAHGFYLIAPKTYLAQADADWSATLAASAGTIRLRSSAGTVVDQLGYGITANSAEGAPAMSPSAGQSIERLPGRLAEGGGNGTDTDSNMNDFVTRVTPLPQNHSATIENADSESEPTTSDGDDSIDIPVIDDSPEDLPSSPVTYGGIQISELLPNPMSPLTDANDEFIELHNVSADPVQLNGYVLKAGSNFHSFYVLADQILQPDQYIVFYSKDTKLAMPNSGGAVELLDPNGGIIDVTDNYGAAPDGQAWARSSDGWAWTLQTTPNEANKVVALLAATKTAKVSSTKPKAAKAAAVKSPKAAKVAKVKAATKKKVKKATKKASVFQAAAATERNLKPTSWLLIGLVVITIGYALYEFRFDLYNLYQRFRRNTPPGGDTGGQVEG